METADVVVIGAGANGTSTAFHLARAGVKRVVVVERQYLGSGATGKSGALRRSGSQRLISSGVYLARRGARAVRLVFARR